MSRKKGLSVDEKRSRMLDFFYEKKDFFQLRELEKQCQKEKGITSMSVKEILQSLVDDGMVDTDKIGTCVYFWAFPSKASQNRKRKISDLTETKQELERKCAMCKGNLEKESVGREDSDDRCKLLKHLGEKRQELQQLQTELERYRECDPEVLKQMAVEGDIAKEATNRWTDNVFCIKSWIKNKFSFEESVIDKQFGIPGDFDYVE